MCSRAAALIEQDWLRVYEDRLERLWHESVRLNANLFLLDRVSGFPVELFALDQRYFWGLVAHALHESCIMTVSRIVGDRSKGAYTLRKLRDDMLKHARGDEARAILRKQFDGVRFTEGVELAIARVQEVRNQWIAHLARGAIHETGDPNKGMPILTLTPLCEIRDSINRLVDALVLDGARAHIYPEYSDLVEYPENGRRRPDVDRILELVVRQSSAIGLPEADPQYWRVAWLDLSDHERQEFNKYRGWLDKEPYDG